MKRLNYPVLSFIIVLLLGSNSLFSQQYEIPSDRPSRIASPRTEADVYKLVPEDTYALPWAGIQWSNIVWNRRVWQDIDVRDPKNEAFAFQPYAPLNSDLAGILMQGFFSDKYKAYNAADDRFTKELSKEEFIKLLTPGNNAGGGFNPQNVTKFRIKEDWLYLDTQQIVVVRILGIAPVVEVAMPDGTSVEKPVFWIWYPDARNYLAGHKVLLGTKAQDLNWDQLFEGRKFNGKIDKMNVLPIAPQKVIDEHRATMKQWLEYKAAQKNKY